MEKYLYLKKRFFKSNCKVENCLMLSEYEQNLIKEKEGPVTAAYRKARKWSLVRQGSSIIQGDTPTSYRTHDRQLRYKIKRLRTMFPFPILPITEMDGTCGI